MGPKSFVQHAAIGGRVIPNSMSYVADLGQARDGAFEHLVNRVFGGRTLPPPTLEHVAKIRVEGKEYLSF
jgi:hypothetical protein